MLVEDRLINYCSQVDINDNIAQKIEQILSPELNWAYFFQRAGSEGVLPLVYRSLKDIQSVIPADAWVRLESSYYTVAARNTLLYEKLNEILSAFSRSSIEVILLKGMALAQTIYADISLRPIYDIDILVRKEDFSLVAKKLKELGYMNSSFYPEDFYKDDIMIDVHCQLLNVTRVKSRRKSGQVDIDEIWKHSRFMEIDGQRLRVLSPEYCLIELCLHSSLHHGLKGLIWLVDIARLIEYYKDEMDWNKFIKDSIKYKIHKLIYYTLYCVKEILSQDIPKSVLDELKHKRQSILERRIFDLILSGISLENIRFYFTFLSIESLTDKLRFLRQIALPSPKVLSAKYNISSVRYIPGFYLFHFKSILFSISKLLIKLGQHL